MRRVYGALLVAMLVVCRVCAQSGRVLEPRWLAVCVGFVWEHADSFLHCVASPFHSFVTTKQLRLPEPWQPASTIAVYLQSKDVGRLADILDAEGAGNRRPLSLSNNSISWVLSSDDQSIVDMHQHIDELHALFRFEKARVCI